MKMIQEAVAAIDANQKTNKMEIVRFAMGVTTMPMVGMMAMMLLK